MYKREKFTWDKKGVLDIVEAYLMKKKKKPQEKMEISKIYNFLKKYSIYCRTDLKEETKKNYLKTLENLYKEMNYSSCEEIVRLFTQHLPEQLAFLLVPEEKNSYKIYPLDDEDDFSKKFV